MDYNKHIAEFQVGDIIEGYYLLKESSLRVTNSGKPFLNAILSDISGSIDAKLWDYSGPISEKECGLPVKVRGEVKEYRGALQFNIARIRLTDQDDHFSLSEIIPSAPIDVKETISYIKKLVLSITDSDYRGVSLEMLERHLEDFSEIPAGKSIHHSFRSGLLMHTANMLRIADFLSVLYGDVINRDLLLAGTLLHDFSKRREYLFSQTGLVTDYSEEGHLLGHLFMGAEEIGYVCSELDVTDQKTMLLQHMVLSHHGEPEYGAVVRPQIAESELLYEIDSIDSRMEIYRESYEQIQPGEFSQRIYALDRKVFRHE